MAFHDDIEPGGEQHSYFAPMVDMLAGVVFLLVIMLAASVLVQRPDFGQISSAQKEIEQIQKQLEEARQEDRLKLDPRRRADAAMKLLVTRLKEAAQKDGFQVPLADEKAGVMQISSDALFFAENAAKLDQGGTKLATTLAQALGKELPCLQATPLDDPYCRPYRGIRLETAALSGPQVGEGDLGKARALVMLGQLASDLPILMAMKARDGADLLTYLPPTHELMSGNVMILRFQMQVPAL